MEIISQLKERGIRLWVENGDLKYQAPQGAMTTEILAQLKTHKGVLISLLEKISTPAARSREPAPGENSEALNPALLNVVAEDVPRQKILDVMLQREITTYLHRSLPLCVVLNDKRYLPWYYTHYIQIFSSVNSTGFTELNYLEPYHCYQDVLECVMLGAHFFNAHTSIISFIIEKLNLGYYVMINLDEYCLSVKQSYKQHHFVHESLIYGYDQEKQEMLGIGFNQNRLFDKISLSFQEFHNAWDAAYNHYKTSAPWFAWSALLLVKPRPNPAEYPFDKERFMRELAAYLFSQPDPCIMYGFGFEEKDVHYGFAVYDVVAACLLDLLEGKLNIDYRAIHLLAEHKQALYMRLEYLWTRYKLNEEFSELLAGYRNICEEYFKMRNVLIRALIEPLSLNQEFTITPDLKEVINRTREDIMTLKAQEYSQLNRIYVFLKSNLL